MFKIRILFSYIYLIGGIIWIMTNLKPGSIKLLFLFIPHIIISGFILYFFDYKKCKKCKTKSYNTQLSGNKYRQYYCKKCKETFWTTHWGNYE